MTHRPESVSERELIELIGAVLDGTAIDEQHERLTAILSADPAARSTYRRLVNLHVTLRTYGPALEHISPPLRGGVVPPRSSGLRLRWWMAGAAAAAGIAAAFLLIINRPVHEPIGPPPPGDEFIARFTGVTRAKFADGRSAPAVGAGIRPGALELSEGFAEITLTNGVRMVLEAPVALDLPGIQGGTLRSGRLVATVPPGATGFAIQTPHARVVDLGTEFGVGVREAGDTEVQVFRGLVVTEWKDGAGRRQDKRLEAGAAVAIDAGAKSAPRGIPFEPDRFVRMFPTDVDAGQLAGPLYNTSRYGTVHVVPAPGPVAIDGDLSDWDRSGLFRSACRPPFDRSHTLDAAMMFDKDRLYLAAHVDDPAPMRSVQDPLAPAENIAWRGGSVIVRLAVDPKLGWPMNSIGLQEALRTEQGAGRRPQDVSDKIVHLVMWFHRPSGKARLNVAYGMDFHGEQTDPAGWEGVIKKDADGRGYTLEYAIPWTLLLAGDRPPQAGDIAACNWTVHWSDQDGKLSRGFLSEITNPAAGPFRFLRGPTWGKAVYHERGDLPPGTVKPIDPAPPSDPK